MLRVAITQATAGMRLAMPVQHPQRGTMLLCEGYMLDTNLVRRLAEMEIHDIWIGYPDTEQIRQYVSPAILQQQSKLIGTVAEMFDVIHRDAHAPLEFPSYQKSIQGLIECLMAEPTAAAYVVELGGSAVSELRHASEVCFLSVLLGLKMQGYVIQQRRRLHPKDARDVVSLGLGAMLHDIGKTALDPEVVDRFERTGDDTDQDWRKHVTLGHKLLSGSIAPSAAGVVLHHHQHFDGTGFPVVKDADGRSRGLSGEDIHVFARIACVANHFDRLRHPIDKPIQPRVRVLKQMLMGPLASRFDPVILASLPLVVPAYPPGSIVTLSSGQRAAVVQWHPESPCQPTVQVLVRPDLRAYRSPIEKVRYDLREHPTVMIVEHDQHDVSQDNFRLLARSADPQKTAA